jgi:hypothetical protein
MANTANTHQCFFEPVSNKFPNQTFHFPRRALALLTMLSFASAGIAQDAQTSKESSAAITVPAGTPFTLVLIDPISSKTVHRGDDIHAQTSSPIAVGTQVAIPAGTFVQGKVDKMSRNGSRGEIQLQSATVIFPDGYVASVSGPLSIESEEGTAWVNPSRGAKLGAVIAPLAGLGIGAAIGSAAHTTRTTNFGGMVMSSSTPKGLAIGSVFGMAAGGAVSLILLARSHGFYVEIGAPMRMVISEPITLAQNQVDDANRATKDHPVAVPVPAPRVNPAAFPSAPADHGTCYTPGTPGTPSTVIAGPPGPNGIPGAPSVIPGIPATPGTPYPCP